MGKRLLLLSSIFLAIISFGCSRPPTPIMNHPGLASISCGGMPGSNPSKIPRDLIEKILVEHAKVDENSEHLQEFAFLIQQCMAKDGAAGITYVFDPARNRSKSGYWTRDGEVHVDLDTVSEPLRVMVYHQDDGYPVKYSYK